MPVEVVMPALSPTMEQGKIASWTVKEGDKVEAGGHSTNDAEAGHDNKDGNREER